jgi:hypothetical protein
MRGVVCGAVLLGAMLSLPGSAAVLETDIFNGHTYYLLTANTWTASQAEAVSLGANLVRINTAAENAWIVERFGNRSGFHIGFTDADVEGVFQWINGEPVTYTNWNPGEPNNFGNEDYAEMDGTSGIWNDIPESGVRLALAETSAPEPSSGVLLALGLTGAAVLRKRLA